jgi:NADPH:quinone reductase
MSMMRAVVVEVGSSNRLVLQEVEEASPDSSEALIRVAAVSLNRGEVRRVQATTQAGFRPG